MLFQEQHDADDNVGFGDVVEAGLQFFRVGAELGRRVNRELQAGDLFRQGDARAVRRAGDMRIHRDDDEFHGSFLSGRNGLLHHTKFPH